MTDDGTYEYYYGCENRLIDVNENGSAVVSYSYDYKGRRISKTVDSNTTKYCYDSDQVIAEHDGSDTLLRKFIYGAGIDEPIMMIDVADSNTAYYYHFDGLGSVAALSDNSADVLERYSYDVFGEPNRVSDVNNPYLFTGRRYDTETGNYYYRARCYKPAIGRFLQTDPIGYGAGTNLYNYVWNNPIYWVDPWGLIPTLDPGPPIGSGPGFPGLRPPPSPTPIAPCIDPPFWCSSFDYAEDLEDRLFGPRGNPWGGGFRHCLAACLLSRRYGPIGRAITDIWDMCYESWDNPDSISDMIAERRGEMIARGSGSCAEGCLFIYPNTPGHHIIW